MITMPVVPAFKPDQNLAAQVRAAIAAHKARLNSQLANRVLAARKETERKINGGLYKMADLQGELA